MMKPLLLIATIVLAMSAVPVAAAEPLDTFLGSGFPYAAFAQLPATSIAIGASVLRVGFAPGPIALPRGRIGGLNCSGRR